MRSNKKHLTRTFIFAISNFLAYIVQQIFVRINDNMIIFNQGSPEDSNSIQLSTRSGKWIHNEKREELSPEVMKAKVDAHKNFVQRANAQLRSISGVYNCVGMVFAARRVHIDDQYVRMILREDGYRKIEKADAEDDDIVVYTLSNKVIHIGRIFGNTPPDKVGEMDHRVLSKWGEDGEYFHRITDLPEALQFDNWEVWTERKGCP